MSCCPAVNYGWGHTEDCERIKFLALLKSNNNYNSRLIITNPVLEELYWWERLGALAHNPIRRNDFQLEIFTDASLSGLGTFFNGKRANGYWKNEEMSTHINQLELLAAFFGLKCFAGNHENCQVLLHIDNTTAISYINRMGGVQFKNLNKITRLKSDWCERKRIWIYATYIPSKMNKIADEESRR